MEKFKKNNLIVIYLIAISAIAVACGFSDSLLSNYFNDAYGINAAQRGFLELPREFPGVISLFMIAAIARLGDIKIAVVSQAMCFIGIMLLANTTPSFYVMSILLFVFSIGIHIYLPIQDSLAMSIIPAKTIGKGMGQVKGVYLFFSLLASVFAFLGFRFGILDFTTDGKQPAFFIAGVFFLISVIFLFMLSKIAKSQSRPIVKTKLIFRKKYIYYYILSIMNGVQKQIIFVYGPWVLIEILGQGADTISLLLIISSLFGIFFLPFLGRCIDKFGIRTMLYVDALSFIGVYLAYAFMTYNFTNGTFKAGGIALITIFAVYICDKLSTQMSIIRSVYLHSITEDKAEILPTMSLGVSLDHIVSIIGAYLSGLVWMYIGPHYIFLIAASFSLINLAIAKIVPLKEEK
ncbi:MAG: MFS transporter [Clostridia bacterium]